MLEMVAVAFDGAHAAEQRLSGLRTSLTDEWLAEVAVIEHDADGRYAVKAKNPTVDKEYAGRGAAIGGLTGVFIGAIGGPLGLFLWGTFGAMTGAAVGGGRESSFRPMIDDLESRLAADASMLVLVGDTPTVDGFQKSLGAPGDRALRQPLTPDQAAELSAARSADP